MIYVVASMSHFMAVLNPKTTNAFQNGCILEEYGYKKNLKSSELDFREREKEIEREREK